MTGLEAGDESEFFLEAKDVIGKAARDCEGARHLLRHYGRSARQSLVSTLFLSM